MDLLEKDRPLEDDVKQRLHEMVKWENEIFYFQCSYLRCFQVLLSEERNYRKANDSYILLAIGNAAWPVGVTQWGIHDRAGNDRVII